MPCFEKLTGKGRKDDDEFPTVTVPVTVTGPPYSADAAPTVTPSRISLVASQHASAKRSATVTVEIPESWNITHASSWPEELSVEFQDSPSASQGWKTVTVDVELKQIPAPGIIDGVVQLVANDGKNLVTAKVSIFHP